MRRLPSSCFMAATGELLVWAIDRNPGGIRSMRSPCDIHTTVEPPVPIPAKRSTGVVDRQFCTAILPVRGTLPPRRRTNA